MSRHVPRPAGARDPRPAALRTSAAVRPPASSGAGTADRRRGRPEPPVVTVRGTADLVSCVPYLVGFTPRRSLVVVSLRGERLRCGLVVRVDLPPADEASAAGERTGELLATVVGPVLRDGPSQVAVLLYDDGPWDAVLRPWEALVSDLAALLEAEGVGVKETAYVSPDRFWSLTCRERACCPLEGTPVEQAVATEPAAQLVLQGRAPRRDREELVRSLAASGPLTTAAVGSAAARELDRRADGPSGAPQAWQRDVVDLFGALAERRGAGGPAPTVEEAGRVLAGLADIHVRDAVAMRWTSWLDALPTADAEAEDPDPQGEPVEDLEGVVTEGSEPGEGAGRCDDPVLQVLVDLARTSDGSWAVPALTLLAMQSWARGEGALANVALERALSLDPRYRMATLVDQLLRAGIGPRWAGR